MFSLGDLNRPNPKSEGRRPTRCARAPARREEGRNPKLESYRGLSAPELAIQPVPTLHRLRIFGLRISFEIRPSDFGLGQRCHPNSTAVGLGQLLLFFVLGFDDR